MVENYCTLKQITERYDVISFDIFDTLLLRPYVKPTDLFLHLERLENAVGFAEARIDAERSARKNHANFEDITIDEIYAEISPEYKKLKSKEMALEKRILQPNPEIKELFDYVKEQNKRIIIVSDTYLPANFLSKILKQKGVDGFEKIYASCEHRKTKRTGNLYKLILQDLKIKNDKILHIGDNAISDNSSAKKLGIVSVQYTKKIDELFSKNIHTRTFYKQNFNNLEASILLGMFALDLKERNYWKSFGYKYAGPAILSYMQWLNDRLIKDKISEVIFLARDGYTLEKVFNLIKTSVFKTHYVYAPRALSVALNIDDINHNKWSVHHIKSLLHYYQGKNEFLQKNTPEIKNVLEGVEFIEKNKKLFKQLAQQEKKIYLQYLKKFKIKSKKLAVIDTNSRVLSGQKMISKIFDNKEIVGYYWIIYEPTSLKVRTFQPENKRDVNWNLMELLMSAPTPSAKKIENGEVVFKEINKYEAKRIEIYPDISEGAIRFVQKYIDIFGKFRINFARNILVNWINIFTQTPTPTDRQFFSSIYHSPVPEHNLWIRIFPSNWYQNNNSPK